MSAFQNGSESKPVLSSIVTESRTPPPSAATPVPATASSVDSRPAPDSNVNPSNRTPEAEIPPSLPADPRVTANSDEAIQNARLPPTSLAPAVSLSPRHQRSISALSYPTRPTELASSAKRMKHLALLETVMDESARLTPTLEQQRAAIQGPIFNPGVHMIPRSSAASVPPQNTMFTGLVPGSVLYSSDRGSGFPPHIPPPVNGFAPPLCPTIGSDSFTMRPFDGSLMNPAPLHHNSGLLPGISGGYPQAVPPPPLLQSVPQYNQQIPGPSTSNPPPFPHVGNQPFSGQYGVRIPVSHNSFTARPQSAVPYPTTCPPLNAPGVGPHLPFPSLSPQLSQPKGNPQLLSILNNKGPGPANFQTSMIPPVGNLMNFQPR